MEYTRLGNSGLLVSRIAYGNMINYLPDDENENTEIIKTLYEAGVNFFDTAESYGTGQAEEQLGRSIKKLQIPREKIIVTVKITRSPYQGGNSINRIYTVNRKHVIEGVDASLKRLQLDYADIVYAHAFDPETPIEEIVRGFNQVIEDGKALYWGTSKFPVSKIQEIFNYCDKHGLIKPIAEQCLYNMVHRQTVEKDYLKICENGFGTTVFSPLHGGLLTGKYNNNQIPIGSRAITDNGWVTKELSQQIFFNKTLGNQEIISKLNQLGELANSLGYTQTQLSLAWCLYNKKCNTAIIGAKNVQQVQDSLKSIELLKKWDHNLEQQVENILQNKPEQPLDFKTWQPYPGNRE